MKKWIVVSVLCFVFPAPKISKAETESVLGSTPPTATEANFSFPDGWWIKGTVGYDYAILGDVINGIRSWAPFAQSQGYSDVTSTNNSGIGAGLEFGHPLSDVNALSIHVENVWTTPESETLITPGGFAERSIIPDLMSCTLDYYHYLFREKNSRVFLVFGAGYYHADVEEKFVSTAVFTGDYTGDTLGGFLGLGQEWALGDNLTLEFSGQGRWAVFDKVTATSGNILLLPGPYALAILSNQNGIIEGKPISEIGSNGLRYAVIDYSGFVGNVSIKFYFGT